MAGDGNIAYHVLPLGGFFFVAGIHIQNTIYHTKKIFSLSNRFILLHIMVKPFISE